MSDLWGRSTLRTPSTRNPTHRRSTMGRDVRYSTTISRSATAPRARVGSSADPDESEVLDLYLAGDGTAAMSTYEWIGTNASVGCRPFGSGYGLWAAA